MSFVLYFIVRASDGDAEFVSGKFGPALEVCAELSAVYLKATHTAAVLVP